MVEFGGKAHVRVSERSGLLLISTIKSMAIGTAKAMAVSTPRAVVAKGTAIRKLLAFGNKVGKSSTKNITTAVSKGIGIINNSVSISKVGSGNRRRATRKRCTPAARTRT